MWTLNMDCANECGGTRQPLSDICETCEDENYDEDDE